MRRIDKGAEPVFLAGCRTAPGADWDTTVTGAQKQDARERLCAEQRRLCCFCEGRIRPEVGAMKIAHFMPQTSDRAQMFLWSNLYGACRGNEGRKPKEQHCDTRQGSACLDERLRPTRLPAGTIGYTMAGKVASGDEKIQADLDERLNLNLPRLVANRKAAQDAMITGMRRGSWTLMDIRRELQRLQNAHDPEPPEYLSFLVWTLERWQRTHGAGG